MTADQFPPRSPWSYWCIRFMVVGAVVGLIVGTMFWHVSILFGLLIIVPVSCVFGGFGTLIDAPNGAWRGGLIGLLMGWLFCFALWCSVAPHPEIWEVFAVVSGSFAFTGAVIGASLQLCGAPMTPSERLRRALGGLWLGLVLAMVALATCLPLLAIVHGAVLLMADPAPPFPDVRIFSAVLMFLIAWPSLAFCGALGVMPADRPKPARRRLPLVVDLTCWVLAGLLWAGLIYGWDQWPPGAIAGLLWGSAVLLCQYGIRRYWPAQSTAEPS